MKKIILAAILAATALQANATVLVLDPANLVQNTVSTMESIYMEIRQAAQYATQLQQYATQAKQVASLGSGALGGQFSDIMNTYRTVRQYQSALAGLQGAVADVQSVMKNRMNLMAASGLSMDQYLQRERDMLKYRQDTTSILTGHERQVMDDAAQRYAQVRALQPQIMATQGTHQAMQVMNSQMNMLTASMQDFITLTAAEGNRKSIEAADKEARDQRAIDADDAYQKLKAQQEADSWETIDQLKTMNVGGKK